MARMKFSKKKDGGKSLGAGSLWVETYFWR